MYRLLMKIIKQDNTISKEEEARRCANVFDYWNKNGNKYKKLVKNLTASHGNEVENYLRYLGFWTNFKLICEGKECTLENLLPFDLNAVYGFMVRAKLLSKEMI